MCLSQPRQPRQNSIEWGLTQQTFTFLLVLELEGWDQGAGVVTGAASPPALQNFHLLTVSSRGLSSVLMERGSIPCSCPEGHQFCWVRAPLFWPHSTLTCCSVAKSYLTSCNPMNCSIPGSSVLGVCSDSCPLSQWCLSKSSSVTLFSNCFPSFPASESFPVNRLFASGGQKIGASASSSVLPVTIQGWFPLGLTGLIISK